MTQSLLSAPLRRTTTLLALAAFAAIAAVALAGAGTADARTALAQLRVEGPNATLDPGTWYVTGTERVRRAENPDCDPRAGSDRYPGPTALGVLATAQSFTKALRPVRARPTDFGPQVCQVGGLKSFGTYPADNAGFLYWVNYVSASSSADLASLRNGDRVLWYYAEFGSQPVNSDKVLELKGVPARDADGEFIARVVQHDYDGTPVPAAGAVIAGAQAVEDLDDGRYAITVGDGFSLLQASRGQDVRSNPVRTCHRAQLARCPAAHGRTIFGSTGPDRLRSTRGWDRISSLQGGDRIDITAGGRDRVRCGGGDDVVVTKAGARDDAIASSCERVIRR